MPYPNYTLNDKTLLRGICLDPWANDRELGLTAKIILSTVTACKNRLKKAGIFEKAYHPAYNRLGYSIVSFSQLSLERPSDGLLKALSKLRAAKFDEDDLTIVSYIVNDPLNALVIAYHRDFSAYKAFERMFGYDSGWVHGPQSMDGAVRVVHFDHTNTVNRIFFPGKFGPSLPATVDITTSKLRKIEKKVLYGLLAHSGGNLKSVGNEIGVTRQSVTRIMNKFRSDGLLERNTGLDLGSIGVTIVAMVTFKADRMSNKGISGIDRILAPYYYWVFGDVHVVLAAFADYTEMMKGLGQLSDVEGVEGLKVVVVEVGGG